VGVTDGSLRCVECSAEYPIENGIARLMTDTLTPEIEHEIALKDQEYAAMPDTFQPPPSGWRSEYADRIEIPPHLDALQPLEGCRVLELACGDGRFTMLMAQLGAELLAVDFSIAGLHKLTDSLPSGVAPSTYKVAPRRPAGSLTAHVGLVQADAGHFHVAPRSFDRALSATPLDSRDERMRMYRTIAEALTDDGRFVGGFDHDDLYRKLFGLPLISRYTPGGVLIEHLDTPTLRREVAPYFSQLHFRPIRAHLPFVKRLSMKVGVSVSLVANKIPGLRQCCGILLVLAEGPIRLPVEGARRPGNAVAKSLYRWYKRRKGAPPLWDPGVEV
jgi:SAM-dependent methyltransferase